jgi:hypothetical protein
VPRVEPFSFCLGFAYGVALSELTGQIDMASLFPETSGFDDIDIAHDTEFTHLGRDKLVAQPIV